MKLEDIYKLVIKNGIERDPRKEFVLEKLENNKKKFEKMDEKNKTFFDEDQLFNPYSDTRVIYGDLNSKIKSILVGIDMETSEILLADRLREKGEDIDLIISHHPEGRALANLAGVMDIQENMLLKAGVPINIAQGLMASRISEVERALMPLNHKRVSDTARILDLPFMTCHTPADNLVQDYLERIFQENKPKYLEDIIDLLLEIEEYKIYAQSGIMPSIVVGNKEKFSGKIYVDMTGGTSGPKANYEKLAASGVGTIVGMHMSEEHIKEAEKNYINVIIAGHMSSDSLGMNLMLDEIEKNQVSIKACSGLVRVRRI